MQGFFLGHVNRVLPPSRVCKLTTLPSWMLGRPSESDAAQECCTRTAVQVRPCLIPRLDWRGHFGANRPLRVRSLAKDGTVASRELQLHQRLHGIVASGGEDLWPGSPKPWAAWVERLSFSPQSLGRRRERSSWRATAESILKLWAFALGARSGRRIPRWAGSEGGRGQEGRE